MAATPSNMMPLGTTAPDFTLPDTISGESKNLTNLKGVQGTIVMFICNHCPYVIHIKDQLIDIAKQYARLGIGTIAISANDIENHPQDAPDKMKALMAEWGNPFVAYCYDESQTVAKAYLAACTPDIYLFDKDLDCVYRGRLDAATPQNDQPLTGKDLRDALDALLVGEPINEEQVPSMGCNIKWK
ncbi:MAG: thioredoxin family protein [Gammaproteobacteria bacterium]|jgi:thiol-disulfide isomerase/thioredoxin|nr:thioredoxin family protein [Gammaproteobacteria bacterium]MBT5221862.1 thioredoxin family protein [Gammaproteobacteria bacterium]MBT5824888.1 thioredoxin family protein [Gammaproteobacteria bacterium]MBT5966561.1 thioredoxin family protein [Gammaproteobacteria bacterium]MBT6419063.1 thioredoxin family protein [Gammaproteobacteria bacterium]